MARVDYVENTKPKMNELTQAGLVFEAELFLVWFLDLKCEHCQEVSRDPKNLDWQTSLGLRIIREDEIRKGISWPQSRLNPLGDHFQHGLQK